MAQVSRLWGRPWILERSIFSDDGNGLNRYLYCLKWGLLVDAEIRCEGIFLTDEEETEEEFLTRICTKGCGVCGAQIRRRHGDAYEMTWRRGTGSTWKAGAQLMLSRSNAFECEKRLVIASFTRQTITFSNDTRMPHDFEEGEWNVFFFYE